MDIGDKNYYDLLETNTSSSQDEIKQAYQRSKNAYSADSAALYSLMSEDECRDMLNLIEEAYTILSDPEKRFEYDKLRGIDSVAMKEDSPERREAEYNRQYEQSEEDKEFSIHSNQSSISKVAAKNRWALNFEVDYNFEQEIENATQFDGEFLKRIREYKNVSIERMSELTKVSKTYLRHLESENYQDLPAEVYTRGFVYQYAKSLKLNPDIVASSYITKMRAHK